MGIMDMLLLSSNLIQWDVLVQEIILRVLLNAPNNQEYAQLTKITTANYKLY